MFEDLINKSDVFLGHWSKLLGLPIEQARILVTARRERARLTQRQHLYHKLKGCLMSGRKGNDVPAGLLGQILAGGPPAHDQLSPEWRERLRQTYAKDNAELAAAYQLPLKEYGYPMP